MFRILGFSAADSIASLDLPKGLTLVKGKASVDLGNILPGGSHNVCYKSRPQTCRR